MANSLSNLLKNFAQGIYRIKFKYGHGNKKSRTCESKYKNCKCFLEYSNFKDNLIKYKGLCCNKNYQIILLLRKGVYSYDDWETFNETSLTKKRRLLESLKDGRYY